MKRRHSTASESESQSEQSVVSTSSSQTSVEEEQQSDIQVDFVFNAPSLDQDYHAIKNLLLQLFASDAKDVDIVAMTEHILQEGKKGFGTVVRCEADDPDEMLDPNAITSLLEVKDQWGQLLKRLIKDKTKIKGDFLWFLHERVSNLPSEVAGPLSKIVSDELQEKKFKIKQVVYICKKYQTVAYTSIPIEEQGEPVPEYANEEDALLSELASKTFTYEIRDEERHADSRASFYDGVGLKEYRQVLVFSTQAEFLQAMEQVQSFAGSAEAIER